MVFGLLGMAKAQETASDNKSTTDESLECSYENCTPLFRNIEQARWGEVMSFLDTGYWPGDFFKDPVNPTEQSKTWVYRFHDKADDEGKKRLRWSQLPLHLALVVKAPFPIVQRLLEINPESVRCTDDQKMLPLHLAMRYGLNDRIVDLLLDAFPDAVHVKAKDDRTPLDCAMRANVLRGKILSTFVKGINAKTTDEYVSQCTQEITELREKLKGKEAELGSVRCQLDGMTIAGVPVQHVNVMNEKITKLEQALFAGSNKLNVDREENDNSTLTTREHKGHEADKFANAHEQAYTINSTFTQEQATVSSQDNAKSNEHEDTYEAQFDFKIIAQDSDTTDGGSIERILTADQGSPRVAAFPEDSNPAKLPLEYFQEEYKDDMFLHIGTPSLIELRSLQEQAMTMTETGIHEFLEGAEAKIEALTNQLASEVQKSDAATREEIRAMQRMIEELKLTAEANAAAAKNPNTEVTALKLEIEMLRKEVKQSLLEVARSRSYADESVKKRRSKTSTKGKGRRPPFASILRASDSEGSKTVLTTDSNSKANDGPSTKKGASRLMKKSWFSVKKPVGRKQAPQSGRKEDPINALRSDFEALRKQLSEMQRVPQVPVPQAGMLTAAALRQNQEALQATKKMASAKPPPTVVPPITDEAAALRMELDALRNFFDNR